MAEVKRDVIYSMLASTLPALGNFVAVALALRHMDSVWLGKSYALVSFFFIAIDLFNFGSARIFTVEAVRSSVPTLIFLDCLSALGSTAVFAPAGILLGRYGLIAQPEFVILMVLAPVCYGMSHFSLGALRACGRSGAICAISLTSALSRVLIIVLLTKHRELDRYLPDLLLLVEAGYRSMLLLTYLQADRKRSPDRLRSGGSDEVRFDVRAFDFRPFFVMFRNEILGSWYSNAIFSGAKHLDMMLVTLIVGPAGGSLYRGVKSVHNLAFNCGQGVALLLNRGSRVSMDMLFHRPRQINIVAGALVLVMLAVAASLLACRIRLFPIAGLGSYALQFGIMFVTFAGAMMIFLCRVLSLLMFSVNRASFVLVSTIEVGLSLVLIGIMSYLFGLLGALLGILVASTTVMGLSFVLSRRDARKVLIASRPCSILDADARTENFAK